MKRICAIYRGSKKEGMYLYVDKKDELSKVPEQLLKIFGKPELAMTLLITPDRKLAQVDSRLLLDEIEENGFFLQMPPEKEAYMQSINQKNSKLFWQLTLKMEQFWDNIPLYDMTDEQWESLCDGCGKCCLNKFQDIDTGDMAFTNVACKLLGEDCRCTDYGNRIEKVPDCINLKKASDEVFRTMPQTCAYRRIFNGEGLEAWHPLISKTQESVEEAGVSIKHRFISEEHVHPDDLEDFIVDWID